MARNRSFLGFGIIRPFQRAGGSDFVAAGDERLVNGAIGQILGTRKGELRWRPDFGMNFERFRHKNMDEGTQELAKLEAANALQVYEPRIELTDASTTVEDTKMTVKVVWQVVDRNNPRNQVLVGPVETEVST